MATFCSLRGSFPVFLSQNLVPSLQEAQPRSAIHLMCVKERGSSICCAHDGRRRTTYGDRAPGHSEEQTTEDPLNTYLCRFQE